MTSSAGETGIPQGARAGRGRALAQGLGPSSAWSPQRCPAGRRPRHACRETALAAARRAGPSAAQARPAAAEIAPRPRR
eukprot:531302-Pyramimonas_sp.AAC.1